MRATARLGLLLVSLTGRRSAREASAPVAFPSDQASSERATITALLQRYCTFVGQMAHDSIAAMYAPDGRLDAPGRAPVVGPSAISAFLQSFAAYRVIHYALVLDSLNVYADTAETLGRWWQRVRVPAGDTVEVSGGVRAKWVRSRAGGWLLHSMGTDSRAAGTPPPGPACLSAGPG
jgi:ketosteroid isomerase-like protein